MTGISEKKIMLSIEQIEHGLREVAGLTEQHGVRALLVGGVAMQHYGSDRFTADLDFAADGPLPGLPSERPLTFGGYQSHTPGGVPVDWIVRSDDYQTVFAEALKHPTAAEGIPMPVVAPEYLIIMKMVARRRKDEVDLETLLELGVVDTEKALAIARRLLGPYAADDLKRHIELAEWNRSRQTKDQG